MPVSCVDGAVGELADVIIDPRSRRLTHLVVAPHDQRHRARLVPTQSARRRRGGGIRGGRDSGWTARSPRSAPLSRFRSPRTCASASSSKRDPTGTSGSRRPTRCPDGTGLGPEIMGSGVALEYDQHVGVNYHRIPKGDVEIRRSSEVTSADGHHLGHVVGFVIDDDDRITETRPRARPSLGQADGARSRAAAIDRFEIDELVLTLSGDEVGALKPLPGHHWGLSTGPQSAARSARPASGSAPRCAAPRA